MMNSRQPRWRMLLWIALWIAGLGSAARAEALQVLAAGSLREVMTEIGDHYRRGTGADVTAVFGPSGVLRERIENGERADLFASADMGNPMQLLHAGRATRVVMFARNRLCGVALRRVGLTTANFLDRLLDPAIKFGTSTPKADLAGDYTWAMFRRTDALRPGSYAILDKKAQQIVGGPTSNANVGGKDPAVAALASGRSIS
jgi:molybdate transport system substrate-binding protein